MLLVKKSKELICGFWSYIDLDLNNIMTAGSLLLFKFTERWNLNIWFTGSYPFY